MNGTIQFAANCRRKNNVIDYKANSEIVDYLEQFDAEQLQDISIIDFLVSQKISCRFALETWFLERQFNAVKASLIYYCDLFTAEIDWVFSMHCKPEFVKYFATYEQANEYSCLSCTLDSCTMGFLGGEND